MINEQIQTVLRYEILGILGFWQLHCCDIDIPPPPPHTHFCNHVGLHPQLLGGQTTMNTLFQNELPNPSLWLLVLKRRKLLVNLLHDFNPLTRERWPPKAQADQGGGGDCLWRRLITSYLPPYLPNPLSPPHHSQNPPLLTLFKLG